MEGRAQARRVKGDGKAVLALRRGRRVAHNVGAGQLGGGGAAADDAGKDGDTALGALHGGLELEAEARGGARVRHPGGGGGGEEPRRAARDVLGVNVHDDGERQRRRAAVEKEEA